MGSRWGATPREVNHTPSEKDNPKASMWGRPANMTMADRATGAGVSRRIACKLNEAYDMLVREWQQ